ncbi:MAG: NAD(P)H-hydrate dehydratase [Pseudomonadales bacterium]|nr:NAD(P)H-hydrate dehydratase [Pseudomonadales bacterium]
MEIDVSMAASLPSELYTQAEVRELDRLAIEEQGISGLTLMRRAAVACVDTIIQAWPDATTMRIYCGSGNNAGDGYIIAGLLAEKNIQVEVVLVGSMSHLSDAASAAYDYCQSSNLQMVSYADQADKGGGLPLVDVIIDALLGTGVRGVLKEPFQAAIREINDSSAGVCSVDIPSGLNGDTGVITDVAVQADITVSFIGLKRGMFTFDGIEQSGRIIFAGLGIPGSVFQRLQQRAKTEPLPDLLDAERSHGNVPCRLLEYPSLIAQLPVRARNAHKNLFGHVLVVGGWRGMGGAVAMAAEAALRSGAGVVSVATHSSHASQMLIRRPELMVRGIEVAADLETLLNNANVVVLGPGLGQSEWSRMIFTKVIEFDLPMVIDADGLNLLAGSTIKKNNWLLTPHPGEARTLLTQQASQATSAALLQDRYAMAKAIRQQYGGVVVLKGAGTIICSAAELAVCPYGNPGMSTAGMGDILAGVIGGLMAQNCTAMAAAKLGVAVHAMAADKCTAKEGERGLLATDILPDVRRLLNAN